MKPAALLALTAGALCAQTVQVYSELAQLNDAGEVVAPANPREILSPAAARNAFSSFQIAIQVPKGTKLHVDAHFDNSPNNKFNPNPNRTVYYGEMTWEEMMFPFFGVVVEKDADPRKIISAPRGPGGA